MRYTIIIAILMLQACGTEETHIEYAEYTGDMPDVYINQDLQDYIDSYLSDAKSYGHEIDVTKLRIVDYEPQEDSTVAICRTWTYPDSTVAYVAIYVDPVKFDKDSRPNRARAVMYHELEHCLRGKDHSENKEDLMFPYTNTEEYYRDNWDAVLNRTFG